MENPLPANPDLPQLQPPGAGLPWLELVIARYLVFPFSVRKLNWTSAAELFQAEGAQVLALWEATPAERLTERALVPRLTGMEDSSRHWSVAMTVEHLNIVGSSILGLIGGLRQGKLPERAARTQDVKPRGEMALVEVRAEFVRLLAEARAADKKSPAARDEGLRAPHPWFGPLNAFQWHCLLGIHQGIHRRQIEAIRRKLDL